MDCDPGTFAEALGLMNAQIFLEPGLVWRGTLACDVWLFDPRVRCKQLHPRPMDAEWLVPFAE